MKLEDAVLNMRSYYKKTELPPAIKASLAVLMIHAMKTPNHDIVPWSCESDCIEMNYLYCRGEHGTVKDSIKPCPFYIMEGK